MKIYFAGSIRGGNEDANFYSQLIKKLQEHGTVLTEHIGESSYLSKKGKSMTRAEIYAQDMGWLMESDVVVADVTTPSLGVGYELAKAEEMNKKLLCLFREGSGKNLSAMVGGNPSFLIVNYSDITSASQAIDSFFKDLK